MPQSAAAAGKSISSPYSLSNEYAVGDRYAGVRIRGSLKLSADPIAGYPLHGLSALAWDADENLLYALSDRGKLFHLRPQFRDGMLHAVIAVDAFELRDARGKALDGEQADSEGMDAIRSRNGVRGDTELIVCFERYPRLVRFTPQGRPLGRALLPPPLRDPRRYRSPNRALEAVAVHPELGILTAAEMPLRDEPEGKLTLYALGDGSAAHASWTYALAQEPNPALTALEVLHDGGLLALERGHGFLFLPFIVSLRRIPPPLTRGAALRPAVTVARFSTGQGFALDNFEGLARHEGARVFLVSDDNGRAFQATLLLYLELLE